MVLAAGVAVVLSGLTARPELNGMRASVLSFDKSAGRYAVKLTTGEELRVRGINVQRSIFG